MNALELIVAERALQVAKGYSEGHDDQHDDGSLGHLALTVLADTIIPGIGSFALREGIRDQIAPWVHEYAEHIEEKYFGDDIHKLVIAAAVLSAEIERRLRTVP